MSDIRVESAVYSSFHPLARRCGPVYTDADTGYVFYLNGAGDFVYRKTATGGGSWPGDEVIISSDYVGAFDIWFDKWTPGDSGTLIHIWWLESTNDDARYRTLDTSTDTLGDVRVVHDGTSFHTSRSRSAQAVSGTKAVGGKLYVQFWGDTTGEHEFYASTDGVSWGSPLSEADKVGNGPDDILLLPDADSLDNQDIAMVYWERYPTDSDELFIIKYDQSIDTWTTYSVASPMYDYHIIMQYSAVVRHSDGAIILVAWDDYDDAEAKLRAFVITLGTATPSITAKTNYIVNAIDDCAGAALFIDLNNDDLYCAYLGKDDGSQYFASSVQAFYKKISAADFAADNPWSSQQVYQADPWDDERYISAGHSTPGAGAGRFQPMFFNDDLNDLFVNKDNSVAISAAAVHEGQATLAGVGSLAVSSAVTFVGSAGLLGEGFLSAAATLGTVQTAAATVTGQGSMSAKAVLDFEAKAAITGVGLLSGKGARDRAAAATFLGQGLLSAIGEVGTEGRATLVGVGSLTADAKVDRLAKATLTGIGGMSARPVVTYAGKATLTGEGFLSAIGETGEILYTVFGRVRRDIDPDAYPPGTLWYFEVTLWAPAGGTARARLFNLTTAQEVADSPLNTSSPTEVRLRSPALTLASGSNIYRAEYGGAIGSAYTLASADVVRVSP